MIRKNLAAIGESFDSLPVHIIKYLTEIQEVVSQKEMQQREALALIKSSSLSVASTMAVLGYSRNTAYRHGGILQRYIEYANDNLTKTNLLRIIDELREETRAKDKQLSLIIESNVANLQLQDNITQLEDVIADKKARIEQMQLRITELNREVLALRASIPKDKSEPLLFKPK